MDLYAKILALLKQNKPHEVTASRIVSVVKQDVVEPFEKMLLIGDEDACCVCGKHKTMPNCQYCKECAEMWGA